MIIVRIYEGLGNQMFEYAYAYALSKKMKRRGIKVYLDMREDDVTVYDKKRFGRPLDIRQFNLNLPIADDKMLRHWDYIANRTFIHRLVDSMQNMRLWKYRVVWEDEFNYDRKYLGMKDSSYVIGWFQHYQYFEKYRKALLNEFTLKVHWEIPLQLREIMEENQIISIHIRRGDYVTDPNVRKSLHICGKDYYINAVEYLKTKVSNPYLFIFTNDEKWVDENLQFNIPNTMISNHYNLSDIQELILMSQCNHNIIANSTFSWWGAWLNTHDDKIVIAPKKWFVDRKRKNIAMESWIKI